jgi:hypothetical protein
MPNNEKATTILDYESYELWTYRSRALIELLPFAEKFYETFNKLKEEGRLQDDYYLNLLDWGDNKILAVCLG